MENKEEKPKRYRGEQFMYLLSEEEVGQFGEDDLITKMTMFTFDAQGNQVGGSKEVFEWRKYCPHCENSTIFIKRFGEK